MNPIKSIAKLNARIGQLRERVESSGIGNLTLIDISMSLVRLPRGPYLISLAAWAGDRTVKSELYDLSGELAIKFYGGQEVVDKTLLEVIGAVALNEYLSLHTCPKCNGQEIEGKSFILEDGRATCCPVCKGTGKFNPTDEVRMKKIGLSKSDWGRYSNTFNKVYSTFSEWEQQAYSHVYKRMK